MGSTFVANDIVAYVNSSGGWSSESYTLSGDSKSITATVDHFSVWGVVTSFDVLQINPSADFDLVASISVDSNFIYVAGGEWRIEKRDITTGGL